MVKGGISSHVSVLLRARYLCFPLNFQPIQRAVKAGHPRCAATYVDARVKTAADLNFVQPPYVLAKMRIDFIRKWTNRAKELQDQEDKLHESMHPHLRKVFSGKRLLVWKEILEELAFEDRRLTLQSLPPARGGS